MSMITDINIEKEKKDLFTDVISSMRRLELSKEKKDLFTDVISSMRRLELSPVKQAQFLQQYMDGQYCSLLLKHFYLLLKCQYLSDEELKQVKSGFECILEEMAILEPKIVTNELFRLVQSKQELLNAYRNSDKVKSEIIIEKETALKKAEDDLQTAIRTLDISGAKHVRAIAEKDEQIRQLSPRYILVSDFITVVLWHIEHEHNSKPEQKESTLRVTFQNWLKDNSKQYLGSNKRIGHYYNIADVAEAACAIWDYDWNESDYCEMISHYENSEGEKKTKTVDEIPQGKGNSSNN